MKKEKKVVYGIEIVKPWSAEMYAHNEAVADVVRETVTALWIAAIRNFAKEFDYNDEMLECEFDGPIFTGTTITGQYVAFYERLGGAASADRVIVVTNWGLPYSSNGAAFSMGINMIEITPSYPS